MAKTKKIIPSDKLLVLSVHKIMALSCPRCYYYQFILNLEPAYINLNFWWGGVLHVGWQYSLLGYEPTKIIKAMTRESRRRARGYKLSSDDKAEMKLQFELIKAYVFAGMEVRHRNWKPRCWDLEWSEEKVSWPVADTGVEFWSTLDGYGVYDGSPSILEIKSSRYIDAERFVTMEFDAQLCSYALGHKKQKKNGARQCVFTVFRKPTKRLKRGQTVPEYVAEIQADLFDRPDFYFMSNVVPMGRKQLRMTQQDIEVEADELARKYRRLTRRGELHNPANWPRRTRHCDDFNHPCIFKQVCRRGGDVRTFLPSFKQREMLYEAEKGELTNV